MLVKWINESYCVSCNINVFILNVVYVIILFNSHLFTDKWKSSSACLNNKKSWVRLQYGSKTDLHSRYYNAWMQNTEHNLRNQCHIFLRGPFSEMVDVMFITQKWSLRQTLPNFNDKSVTSYTACNMFFVLSEPIALHSENEHSCVWPRI